MTGKSKRLKALFEASEILILPASSTAKVCG